MARPIKGEKPVGQSGPKVIIDDKIPYIKGEIERLASEVRYLPGSQISNADVRDADALIVRTRTRCDRALLEGSAVRFIVTATIGFDHIDTDYCREAGIEWTNCPGCNANSVRWYVHNAIEAAGCLRRGMKVGIVGVGHVGSRVAADLRKAGLQPLLYDPPLADQHPSVRIDDVELPFVSLETIIDQADIITFHTPLTRSGAYPTFHMASSRFFDLLGRRPLVINASRGGVVDNEALLRAIRAGKVRDAVIDTWEDEPDINCELLREALIATPHIAGYSADGKANATRMSLCALARFFDKEFTPNVEPPAAPLLSVDTLLSDSRLLKQSPERFEDFRGNYPVRREPSL